MAAAECRGDALHHAHPVEMLDAARWSVTRWQQGCAASPFVGGGREIVLACS